MFNQLIMFFFSLVFSIAEPIDYKIHSIDRNNIILYEDSSEIINYSNSLELPSQSEITLMKYHGKILTKNSNKELIIVLKTGEILQVSHPRNISDRVYEVNILKQNLNPNFSYNNSKISRIKNKGYSYPKRIKEINLGEVLYIDVISHEKEFKIMRDYTLVTIALFFIISAFF